MKTSATNRKIRVLLTAIEDKALVPRPEFQRRLVWSNKHKEAFLDTVLRGFPFPEIYIASGEVNPETGRGIEMLVDGQQRITTLLQYFTGDPSLRLAKLEPYSKIGDARKEFLEYEVVIRDLGPLSIEAIREVFERINSTNYALNAMEVANARYDGPFKKCAEELAQHSFFESNRVFRANEIRRMSDVRFTLTVIVSMMSTYFHRDSELDSFLERFNDEFNDEMNIKNRLDLVFSTVDCLELGAQSRAWKKADLLTLLVEMDRFLVEYGPLQTAKAVRDSLMNFYDAVDHLDDETQETAPKQLSTYYRAALQGSNDRSSRLLRGAVLADVLRGVTFRE